MLEEIEGKLHSIPSVHPEYADHSRYDILEDIFEGMKPEFKEKRKNIMKDFFFKRLYFKLHYHQVWQDYDKEISES